MASTYLTRTPSSNGNLDKWTLSVWVKKSKIQVGATGAQYIASAGTASIQNTVYFDNNDRLIIEYYKADVGNYYKKTNKVFRDTSAWYHIVAVWDTGNATAEDRMRLYVNGERETSWQSSADPGQDLDGFWNSTSYANNIGQLSGGTSRFDGLMSHLHFIDGTVYTPSTFGSTDSTTGEWKINTSPSVTYGTNGFFILKDGNSVTDQSGNSNNLTASGNLTNTEDCPSNVFATLNPLTRQVAAQLASSPTNGSTTLTSGSGSAWGTLLSTIGASSGKYYCEAKLITLGSYARLGICDMSVSQQNSADSWFVGQTSGSAQYGYNSGNGNLYTNAGDSSYGNSFTAGDIIGIAMDLDNSKLYFHKNGTYQNSGVPTSGSTGTGATSITADKTYGFAISGYASTVWNVNFGNGYFGTTAISSEGTNASGIGKFEYDVPTGYTALSTKGLNE